MRFTLWLKDRGGWWFGGRIDAINWTDATVWALDQASRHDSHQWELLPVA